MLPKSPTITNLYSIPFFDSTRDSVSYFPGRLRLGRCVRLVLFLVGTFGRARREMTFVSKGNGVYIPRLGRGYCVVTSRNSATQGGAFGSVVFSS
jgi:hypothetical protein